MNVDLTKSTNNVYYKRCETTYNEKLKELIDSKQVSLRGLKKDAISAVMHADELNIALTEKVNSFR